MSRYSSHKSDKDASETKVIDFDAPRKKSAAGLDPDEMEPRDRRDYYISERERLAVEEKQQQLVDKSKVKEALTRTFAIFSQSLQSLPDTLERRAKLSPKSTAIAQEVINELLNDLADALGNISGDKS